MSTSLLLKTYFAARAGRYRLAQPRPKSPGQVAVAGPDPYTILITGAGLAAGYGVTDHEQTLAGALAASFAEATGRGVTIDIRTSPLLPARRAITRIGAHGAHGYHAAVFAPCYLEAPFAPGAGMPQHGAAIQQHLLHTGGPDLQLLMLGIPRPSRYSRLNAAAAEAATITNRTMRVEANQHPRVHYLDTPSFETLALEHPFNASYYTTLGHAAADAHRRNAPRPARPPEWRMNRTCGNPRARLPPALQQSRSSLFKVINQRAGSNEQRKGL